MRELQYSSGDLVADRRASYAAALAGERAYAEAAELLAQALELVPGWAAGWDLMGEYCKKAGDVAGAVAAWTRLLELDREGVFGARLKLAAHGAVEDIAPAPEYVAALFDDYAPRFETALVEKLGYQTPDKLAAAVISAMRSRPSRPVRRAVDLGCGTGLMGERLRPLVERLEGVDLSAGMLALAARKAIYDRLEHEDLVGFLEAEANGYDLIVAADVFNYVGDLGPVLSSARRLLPPGGLLAFTLETHVGDEPVRLADTLRFQHSSRHVLEMCQILGFRELVSEETVIRMEKGAPVAGLIVVARAGLALIECTPDGDGIGNRSDEDDPFDRAA